MPISIRGKQYVTVAERITAFHEQYPNGSIHTIVDYPDEKTVRSRASVWPDVENQARYFTGHAEEVRGSNDVNRTSATENAETSAVGRALANLGIHIDTGVASADEMAKVVTVDEPTVVELPEKPTRMTKTCIKCGKSHQGKYTKCLDCWKADKQA